jgi:hypothetical protein
MRKLGKLTCLYKIRCFETGDMTSEKSSYEQVHMWLYSWLVFQADILRKNMLDWVLTAAGTLIFLVAATFHVVFLYNWRWLFRRADCMKIDMIPGPKQVPFFGNIFLLKQPEGGKCLFPTLT